MPSTKDRRFEDPAVLLAELERVHGPEVAAIARKAIAADPPEPRWPVPRTEGKGREGPYRGSYGRGSAALPSVAVKDGGRD